MKKYNVVAEDANLNRYQIFTGIDEKTLNEFLEDYCEKVTSRIADPWDENYRWLKDYELPEYNLPYRSMGWIIRFCEA